MKKGTLASPETALASNVLPVPGEPSKRAPLGIFAPIFKYFFWDALETGQFLVTQLLPPHSQQHH